MSKDTVPAEKIQNLIDAYWEYEKDCMTGAANGGTSELRAVSRGRAALYRTVIADLEQLIPPKSMAYMTDGQRADCQWMQARVMSGSTVVIIKVRDEDVRVLHKNGGTSDLPFSQVTPLPDEPRAELPWYTGPF